MEKCDLPKMKSNKIYVGVVAFLLVFGVCIKAFWTLWVPDAMVNLVSRDKVNAVTNKKNFTRERVILAWNTFFGDKKYMSPSLKDLNCSFNQCRITYNRKEVENFDAVVMHWRDIDERDLPTKKFGQRVALLNFESPPHTSISQLDRLQPLIDWTVTYRKDSDIQAPYGSVVRNTVTKPVNVRPLTERRLAAWMVSDCQATSHRREIVRRLQKLNIAIDEYGRCPSGNKALTKVNADQGYKYLGERYKFYLSFENSLCKDYVTEKAFFPLVHGMVPVVFGGANYANTFPPNSYVDVMDFHSLKDLAEYLNLVERSPELYAKYHEWRRDFQIEFSSPQNRFFCDICEKIHRRDVATKRNLKSWWNENACFSLETSHLDTDLSKFRSQRNAMYEQKFK